MATGASTADVAILLVDARQGVRVQSRRHARIARLLGISDFVLAINKMDLIDFDRDVFEGIRDEFEEILRGARFHAIPISALLGDNVITTSSRTPWFEGPSLLEFLETVEVARNTPALPLRFPVQLVVRPNDEFRGYAGQIASGTARVGGTVHVWPSGRSARVTRIVTYDGDLDLAYSPMSVTLTLDDEIDISRGDVIATDPPMVGQRFEAEMVWMDERPLDPARVYLLKHASKTVTAEFSHGMVLNQIGTVTVSTTRPLVFDRYETNRGTGSFIVIDPGTQFTAGAGMIVNAVRERGARGSSAPVSAAERLALLARRAASDAEAVEAIRKALEELLR
jgi:sulfate adenylyltransferase large subunit